MDNKELLEQLDDVMVAIPNARMIEDDYLKDRLGIIEHLVDDTIWHLKSVLEE